MTNESAKELEKVLADLSAVDNAISFLSIMADNIKSSGTDLRDQENELLKLLGELRTQIDTQRASWHKAQQEVRDEQYKQEQLFRRKSELLAIIGAEEHLKALEEKLKDIIANYDKWTKLFEYQRQDVNFIVGAFDIGKSGVLNANGMGLGKTAITAAALKLITPLFLDKFGHEPKVLWLTKKSLIKSSQREILKWDSNRKFMTLDSIDQGMRNTLVELAVSNGLGIICNYEATSSTSALKTTEWDIVVVDEVHRLKGGANPTPTKVWLNARDIVRRAKFFLPLSGTPIANHPKDVWAYLHLFDPVKFKSLKDFENTFCYGYEIGLLDHKKLISLLSDQTIRREKHEVETQLPDLTIDVRMLEFNDDQTLHYKRARDQFFISLPEDESLNITAIIAQLTRLRQIALIPSAIAGVDCDSSSKLDETMEIIEQLNADNEQVVVFTSQFNEPLFELKRRCSAVGITCETITGANSSNADVIEQKFQNGDIQVLAINMATGSEGLNLQKNPEYWKGGASNAIFLDQWWSPTRNQQGIDRIHRTGQTHACTVYVLQCENSVDQFIQAILDEKEHLIHSVMDSQDLRKGADWKSYLSKLI